MSNFITNILTYTFLMCWLTKNKIHKISHNCTNNKYGMPIWKFHKAFSHWSLEIHFKSVKKIYDMTMRAPPLFIWAPFRRFQQRIPSTLCYETVQTGLERISNDRGSPGDVNVTWAADSLDFTEHSVDHWGAQKSMLGTGSCKQIPNCYVF